MQLNHRLIFQISLFLFVTANDDYNQSEYILFYNAYGGATPVYIRDAQVSITSLADPNMYANLTCPPDSFYIDNSTIPNAGLGAFARLCIPEGIYFGPYGGIKTKKIDDENGYAYAWAVFDADFYEFLYYVDALDPQTSNWLRYINCPIYDYQQNLISIQYDGEIFYQSIRNIQADEELFVYYGDDYARSLHINLTQPFEHLESIPKRYFY